MSDQLTPPGLLDWHLPIALLTPALCAGVMAVACLLLGRTRTGRVFCGMGLAMAFAVALVALRPGAIAAIDEAVAGGWLRSGWLPQLAQLLLGLAAARCWWPRPSGPSPAGCCARVSLSMAMSVTVLPLLWLGAEAGQRPGRWRALRLALALLGSLPPLFGLAPLWSAVALATLLLLVTFSTRGPWRGIAALAMAAVCFDVALSTS